VGWLLLSLVCVGYIFMAGRRDWPGYSLRYVLVAGLMGGVYWAYRAYRAVPGYNHQQASGNHQDDTHSHQHVFHFCRVNQFLSHLKKLEKSCNSIGPLYC